MTATFKRERTFGERGVPRTFAIVCSRSICVAFARSHPGAIGRRRSIACVRASVRLDCDRSHAFLHGSCRLYEKLNKTIVHTTVSLYLSISNYYQPHQILQQAARSCRINISQPYQKISGSRFCVFSHPQHAPTIGKRHLGLSCFLATDGQTCKAH